MPSSLLRCFLKPIFCAGGQRECGGALSNEAPLRTPGRRTCRHPPWVAARAAGGCTSLLSSHLMCHSLSLAHRGRTLPQRIISFSMPFLMYDMLTHPKSIVISCPAPLFYHRLVRSVAHRSRWCRARLRGHARAHVRGGVDVSQSEARERERTQLNGQEGRKESDERDRPNQTCKCNHASRQETRSTSER